MDDTCMFIYFWFFFFSSRRRHTRWTGDWSSDVCSSDLLPGFCPAGRVRVPAPTRFGWPRYTSIMNQEERDRELGMGRRDRKSTRLNSSHPSISYAVFCLKKKKNKYLTCDWLIACSTLAF